MGEDEEEMLKYKPVEERDNNIFGEMEMRAVFDVIMAANFLDMKDLLDTACKVVAERIKGKDEDGIREAFGITEPFTMEEKVQVMRENRWLMDGCEDIPEHREIKEKVLEIERKEREQQKAAEGGEAAASE